MYSIKNIVCVLNSVILLSTLQLSLAHNTDTEIHSDKKFLAKQYDAKDSNANPIILLQEAIIQTQKILIQSKDTLSKDPNALIKYINTYIMSLLATDIIAQLLVGKVRWQSANKIDHEKFISEITQMLAYSYAENIAQARNYDIQIFPFRNNSWHGQRLIVVTGRIINLQNKSSSDLSIKMLNEALNTSVPKWKIYDLSIAGISILSNFSAQFKEYKNLKDINTAIEKKKNDIGL